MVSVSCMFLMHLCDYPQLLSAVVGKLEVSSEPMPQDLAEGVDDEEWVSSMFYLHRVF